jgi:hypothetical protein
MNFGFRMLEARMRGREKDLKYQRRPESPLAMTIGGLSGDVQARLPITECAKPMWNWVRKRTFLRS